MQHTINFPEAMPQKVRNFFKFHQERPELYDEIKSIAHRIMQKTNRSVSFSMIYETARFEVFIRDTNEEVFKMNNNYRAAYSRMLLREFPMYHGRIELRSSIFDDYIKIDEGNTQTGG